MTRMLPKWLSAALAALFVVVACEAVPTFADGVAYISPIKLPAKAVAAGDKLRDSTGAIAPLTVEAYDAQGVLVPGVTATYIVSTLPAGVTVDANGVVTALDSIRTVQIVARIGDRLQTTAATLDVVAQPDSMARSGTLDSLAVAAVSSALQVTITGNRRGTRVPVKGIVVRYRITGVFPSRSIDPTQFFFLEGLSKDLTRSADTTDASGSASRTIETLATGIDSIVVQADANSLLGQPLNGSPMRFALRVKKGG
ncbi:MAG: hypothetical protein V4550_16670 [Gemmatimonadota bacterium]